MVSVSPADSVAVLRPCQIVPGCVAMTSAGSSRQRCAQRWRCFTICHQAVHTLACPGMPARSGFTGGVHNFTVEVRPGMSSVSDRLHWHWPTRLSINRELYSNSGLTLGFSHLSGGQGPAHAARRFGGMYSRPQQLCNFKCRCGRSWPAAAVQFQYAVAYAAGPQQALQFQYADADAAGPQLKSLLAGLKRQGHAEWTFTYLWGWLCICGAGIAMRK